MKKILLLLIGLTIISCSSDDDDITTTDPLIGNWVNTKTFGGSDGVSDFTLRIKSDGTYIFTYEYEGVISNGRTINGSWENSGTDFNLLNQIYSFSGISNSGYRVGASSKVVKFTSDFNSFTYPDGNDFLADETFIGSYIRQ